MSEAAYALVGVAVGAIIPAVATIWQANKMSEQAEKERLAVVAARRETHRLSLLESWRNGLAEAVKGTGTLLDGGANPLYEQPWYLSLRPHLSDDARRHAEPRGRTLVISGDAPVLFSLSDEIARIEKEWDLT